MRARGLMPLAAAGLTLLAAACGGSSNAPAQGTTAATQAATQQPTAKTLFVQADVVRGPDGLSDAEKAYLSCVQQNRYPQGSQAVWRVRIFDPTTGKPMDDKALKNVALTLPDGTTQALKYGAHPKGGTEFFWTTSFKIPASYPTGSFAYKIDAADNQGRTGQFLPFQVAPSVMQIVPAGQR